MPTCVHSTCHTTRRWRQQNQHRHRERSKKWRRRQRLGLQALDLQHSRGKNPKCHIIASFLNTVWGECQCPLFFENMELWNVILTGGAWSWSILLQFTKVTKVPFGARLFLWFRLELLSSWSMKVFWHLKRWHDYPETNSKRLWKRSFFLGWPIFRCYFSFREGSHRTHICQIDTAEETRLLTTIVLSYRLTWALLHSHDNDDMKVIQHIQSVSISGIIGQRIHVIFVKKIQKVGRNIVISVLFGSNGESFKFLKSDYDMKSVVWGTLGPSFVLLGTSGIWKDWVIIFKMMVRLEYSEVWEMALWRDFQPPSSFNNHQNCAIGTDSGNSYKVGPYIS